MKRLLTVLALFLSIGLFAQVPETGDTYYGPTDLDERNTKLTLVFNPPCESQFWVMVRDTSYLNEEAVAISDTAMFYWHYEDSTATRKNRFKVEFTDIRPRRIDIMGPDCLTYVKLYVIPQKGWEEKIILDIEEGINTHFMYCSPNMIGVKEE